MKIGYVIHRFPWPSETFVSREVANVISLGRDVEIYSFERPGNEDARILTPEARKLMDRTQYISRSEAVKSLLSFDVLSILGEERKFARNATAIINRQLMIGRSIALAKRFRADGIIGAHAHWPYATQATHLASIISGTPYSVSIHAHEVAHDNGHFKVCFDRLKFASFCNAAAMNYLHQRLGPSCEAKSHLIYHGVDIGSFEVQPPPVTDGTVRILSAGRLTKSKGFDRLVRACALAARRGIDVHLTILGRGSEEVAIRAVAEDMGFSGRLSLPGWVPHSEVPGFLRGCHLFALLASDDFNDGLPNVVVEAMASGRPVVLSPLPAAKEIIEHRSNGFILSSSDDQEGLIGAIQNLAVPGAAERMSQAARDTVVARYDASVHIVKMNGLFEEAFK